MTNKKQSGIRLNPLECNLCTFAEKCGFGQIRDEMHRLKLSIRFEHCALYNGGKLFESDSEPKVVKV